MGKKTSVYLTDDLIPRVEAAGAGGVSLGDIVRRGLDAGGPTSVEASLRRVLGEMLEPLAGRLDALERAVTARAASPARPERAAPKSLSRARSVNAAAAAVKSGDPGAALRALRAVTPGTQVFQEPGADPVAGHPVPAGRSRKAGAR